VHHWQYESLGLFWSQLPMVHYGQTNNGLGEEMLTKLNHGGTPQKKS
jgi:hypothetical protein